MSAYRRAWVAGVLALAVVAVVSRGAESASQPKYGGVLNAMQREDLTQGFAIHETTTISGTWVSMPCFSNLVWFDPKNPVESADSIIPDLAEKWSWQDNYRNLVFFLRKDVKWHDGQPFTSKDVKFTFDVVREAKDAPAKLRLNPRKPWYANIDAIETPDPYTVIFKLKRPQPALLIMLASGYSPVIPAHVPPAELRTRCVGTGPFKLKEWKRGEYIELVKNPDYFIKGRPYLDGIKYIVISERGTRMAALRAGRLDIAFPADGTKTIADDLKAAVPSMVITPAAIHVSYNVLVNATKPPFDNVKLRQVVNLAIDRRAFNRSVAQNAAVLGPAVSPRPYGVWAVSEKELLKMSGYGDPAKEKAEARRLLAEAGYGPSNPLKIDMVTRGIALYQDFAAFVVDELRKVGIEGTPRIIESAQWDGVMQRKEYQLAPNMTGVGVEDPDPNFYENFMCGSARNYTGYCNKDVDALIERQSAEVDRKKRLALVIDLQKKVHDDGARPIMGWMLDYFAHWPHVKGFVPHHNIYNNGRMQDVWLDR